MASLMLRLGETYLKPYFKPGHSTIYMDVTKELYAVFQFWLSVGQGAGGSVSLMPQLSRQSIGKMKQA